MDGQRQRFGRGKRKKQKRKEQGRAPAEPILIAARRPDSPRLGRAPGRVIAASAVPPFRRASEAPPERAEAEAPAPRPEPEAPRRRARIVTAGGGTGDAKEKERQKLLRRLMESDGRGAITRAADAFLGEGFELPDEQAVHLQLLEHFDESRAETSLVAMKRLLAGEPPRKRPVLEQRLRRLEEHADEPSIRSLAAEVRRTLRP